jgi:hypothetical protein
MPIYTGTAGAPCAGSMRGRDGWLQLRVGREGRWRCSPMPLSRPWCDARVGIDQERERSHLPPWCSTKRQNRASALAFTGWVEVVAACVSEVAVCGGECR